MEEGFGKYEQLFGHSGNFPNCSFCTFDIDASGSAWQVVSGIQIVQAPAKAVFQVLSVTQSVERDAGHYVYIIEIAIGTASFVRSAYQSELRCNTYDILKDSLKEHMVHFELAGLFPSKVGLTHRFTAMLLQDYLEQLATSMGRPEFPTHIAETIIQWLCSSVEIPV